ncbi:hypothetical protein D7267_08525 [Legionella pneumophila]|nr:hypothetical protein D7267_08525 [Legionella pneumophila]RYX28472.1 hypothetical protein D8B28_08850 [Legionella pneumophila]
MEAILGIGCLLAAIILLKILLLEQSNQVMVNSVINVRQSLREISKRRCCLGFQAQFNEKGTYISAIYAG